MALPDASVAHYKSQQRVGGIAAAAARRLWSRVDDNFDAGWQSIRIPLVRLVTAAQFAAASNSAAYIPNVLFETGQVDLPAGDLLPNTFAGTAGDGRALDTLLYGAVTTTKEAMTVTQTTQEALERGAKWLTMSVLTAIADAGREAEQAGIGQRPGTAGWIRMLNPPSCPRCIVLAGKWFRWNQGFQRHPRCDCIHVPASESIGGDLTTDPYAMFRSMTKADQDRLFGAKNAQAVRDGADIYRVVNVSQRGLATARNAARFGTPSRMTVDDIYAAAKTRTEAVTLLTREGYITGPQTAGGNILGLREGFGQFGRGGTRIGASAAVRNSRFTGTRQPLDRYTMTAAERRLYDAYLLRETVLSGRNPWGRRPLTTSEFDLAERLYLKQINDLPNQPAQVHALARTLGIL